MACPSRYAYKWTLTGVASLATITCTFASSTPSAAVPAFAKDFGVSAEVANLITTLFLRGTLSAASSLFLI
jgi:hypothetical protein